MHTAVGVRGELVAAFSYIVNQFAVHGLHEFLHRVEISAMSEEVRQGQKVSNNPPFLYIDSEFRQS